MKAVPPSRRPDDWLLLFPDARLLDGIARPRNERRGFFLGLSLCTVHLHIGGVLRILFFLTTALVVVFAPSTLPLAWATLGQSATSVEVDRAKLNGKHQHRGELGYSVNTIKAAGMEIMEYVSSDDVVFAVVWKGTGVPDLKLLLGEYYEEYRQEVDAARNRSPRVREPFKMKSNRLVVERAGHSRSLWGRAYLPSHLPTGIKPEDIQ